MGTPNRSNSMFSDQFPGIGPYWPLLALVESYWPLWSPIGPCGVLLALVESLAIAIISPLLLVA